MLQQFPGGPLLITGNLTGLPPGKHAIAVHTLGDLRKGCESLGPIFDGGLVRSQGFLNFGTFSRPKISERLSSGETQPGVQPCIATHRLPIFAKRMTLRAEAYHRI